MIGIRQQHELFVCAPRQIYEPRRCFVIRDYVQLAVKHQQRELYFGPLLLEPLEPLQDLVPNFGAHVQGLDHGVVLVRVERGLALGELVQGRRRHHAQVGNEPRQEPGDGRLDPQDGGHWNVEGGRHKEQGGERQILRRFCCLDRHKAGNQSAERHTAYHDGDRRRVLGAHQPRILHAICDNSIEALPKLVHLSAGPTVTHVVPSVDCDARGGEDSVHVLEPAAVFVYAVRPQQDGLGVVAREP
mmetsp:Transcript_28133/g.45102  ORF Transcript_28133/g.45102 Transcript_28133/m.45102 type:complete len:244 (-) Transcript_28133:131-862(-)